ncbi:hypothetical protein L207DRAFT_572774 [Hyaloscypha variabilis F]|uniref:Uncharacterized protein n=1 Tax=Hyaloscypha variabilis (strain UAMH 11265 / GT02V1 / F) TaxID=1149755 RepID=A0A2J6QZ78_HYAVF|nr:hypothetical protein L207DRAFT_572774 [Hyaloscypha variabilis F]
MYTQALFLSVLVAIAEARFGQEQIPIPAIASAPGGTSGEAQTLAGQSISTLLGAANPCAKLTQADLILSELGSGALEAAIGLVAAEQNFNNFVVDIPSICNDPTLPTSLPLRGITPLIDPGVVGSDIANALSNSSKITPLNAVGLSVAEVLVANGFSNFTAEDAAGNKVAASTLEVVSAVSIEVAPVSATPVAVNCGAAATTFVTVTKAAQSTAAAAVAQPSAAAASSAARPASSNAVTGVFTGFVASTIAGLDFGLCVPTMKFEPGLDGRSDTEFTFQAQDPLINKGQEEALNPAIIAKKICDQLTNVCNANAAAKAACTTAEGALGGKVASTASNWNTQLGFADALLNPDNAPQAGLVGHD